MRRIIERFFKNTEEEEAITPYDAVGRHVDTELRIRNLKKDGRRLIAEGKSDTEEARIIRDEIIKLEREKEKFREIALPRKVS
ncbi:MAG: hypothetical protein Q7S16_00525 [bacterium]|nr:hypothetical protein [bacterium]